MYKKNAVLKCNNKPASKVLWMDGREVSWLEGE